MPLYHCSQCHHEYTQPSKCDWCGAPSILVVPELPEDKFWQGDWKKVLARAMEDMKEYMK